MAALVEKINMTMTLVTHTHNHATASPRTQHKAVTKVKADQATGVQTIDIERDSIPMVQTYWGER